MVLTLGALRQFVAKRRNFSKSIRQPHAFEPMGMLQEPRPFLLFSHFSQWFELRQALFQKRRNQGCNGTIHLGRSVFHRL